MSNNKCPECGADVSSYSDEAWECGAHYTGDADCIDYSECYLKKIKKLEKTIAQVLNVMGPSRPSCCQGCEHEWDEAIRILKGAGDA